MLRGGQAARAEYPTPVSLYVLHPLAPSLQRGSTEFLQSNWGILCRPLSLKAAVLALLGDADSFADQVCPALGLVDRHLDQP